MKNLYIILLVVACVVTIKQSKAQTNDRIIGWSHYGFPGGVATMLDSINYTYSNQRGSIEVMNEACDIRTNIKPSGSHTRSVNQFDIHNNLIEAAVESWAAPFWVEGQKISYTYNAANLRTSETLKVWMSNVLINYSKTETDYNSSGDTTVFRYYIPDSAFNFVLAIQAQYYHDNQNHRTAMMYSESNGGVIGDTMAAEFYTYDGSGRMILRRMQGNDVNNNLHDSEKEEFNYDGSGRLADKQLSMLQSGGWEPTHKTVYYYNASGKLERQRYFFSDGLGGLRPVDQNDYHYNSQQLNDTMVYSMYETVPADFVARHREVRDYDGAGNMTALYTQIADTAGLWYHDFMSEYEYNQRNNITLLRDLAWNGSTFDITEEEKFRYETYTPVTGIEKAENADLRIYPNPAQDNLNIELPEGKYQTLSLVNLQGQTALQSNINNAAARLALSTATLIPGIYLLNLQGEENSISQKIIIQ